MTRFEDIKDTQEFRDFLAMHRLALPNRFRLQNNASRLVDLDNNSNSVFMTFYDEISANNGKPFVRVYWYNGKGSQFFRVKGKFKRLSKAELKKQQEENRKRQAILEQERLANMKLCQDEFFEVGVPLKFHPYLESKNVFAYYGLRYATRTVTEEICGETKTRIAKGDLLMPIMSLDKQFMSYQRINAKGKKMLCRNGSKKGGVYPIGRWNAQTTRVILCEGYATGATIHEATHETVFVCLDINNVITVAQELKEKYPHVEVIFATDYDLDKMQAGLINTLIYAVQLGFKFIFPTAVKNGSDWNDLLAETNMNTVNRSIFEALEVFKTKTVEEVAKSYYHLLNDDNYAKVA